VCRACSAQASSCRAWIDGACGHRRPHFQLRGVRGPAWFWDSHGSVPDLRRNEHQDARQFGRSRNTQKREPARSLTVGDRDLTGPEYAADGRPHSRGQLPPTTRPLRTRRSGNLPKGRFLESRVSQVKHLAARAEFSLPRDKQRGRECRQDSGRLGGLKLHTASWATTTVRGGAVGTANFCVGGGGQQSRGSGVVVDMRALRNGAMGQLTAD